MSPDADRPHAQLAADLRARTAETGVLDRDLRVGILARGAGGHSVAEPYDALAEHIDRDSSRVTDAQVTAVLQVAGSERAAFEVVLTAAIGAGLRRWDAAAHAIDEARDAAS